jgi:nicotinamide-nucleotide amidase
MEDYSGGLIASGLADVEGNQRFFKGGVIAQTDDAKAASGVAAAVLDRHGSVSPEAAVAMAEAVRDRFGASIGIGVTGIDSGQQPTGTVHIAIVDSQRHHTAARPRGKQRVLPTVLFELRRRLLETAG